jgi:hypothetical protein
VKPGRQRLVSEWNVRSIGRPSIGVGTLPSLDEVADRPEILSQLSRAAVATMLYRALAIQQVCFAELVAGWPEGEIRDNSPYVQELLTAAEVARMMGGISPRQVYRQAKQFPFSTFSVRPTPGTVRFNRHLVEQYLQDPEAYRVRHARAAASEPSPPAPRFGRGNGRS